MDLELAKERRVEEGNQGLDYCGAIPVSEDQCKEGTDRESERHG